MLGWFMTCVSTAQAQVQLDFVDSWIFSGQTESAIRKRFKELASAKVDQLDNCCNLTTEQKRKLLLAAAGDIDRFFHEINKVRRENKGVQMQDQVVIQQLWAKVIPYATRIQGNFFDETTLFAKVIDCTLDGPQAASYSQMKADLAKRKDRALTLQVVASLEESVPLLAEQRAKMIELLDQQPARAMPPQFEPYFGYAKLAKIKEEDLAKFLDKEQVRTIRQISDRYAPVLQAIP
jgi:hypothetical protein